MVNSSYQNRKNKTVKLSQKLVMVFVWHPPQDDWLSNETCSGNVTYVSEVCIDGFMNLHIQYFIIYW